MNDEAPELAIRCWAGKFDDQWLVIRVNDRRIVANGSLEYCLAYVERYATTLAASAAGSPLPEGLAV